jgi:hypothetical protein
MWRIYGEDAFAVAIETTVGALRAVFGNGTNVAIGGVEYTRLPTHIDFAHELFFHKRPEFESEREVRSVQVFPDRIAGKVQLQAVAPSVMDGLLSGIVAAPGMRGTMYRSLQALVVALLAGQGRVFEAHRFRRSTLDEEQLPQYDVEPNILDHG